MRIVKSLLALMLVSATGACVAAEDDTYGASDDVEVTESAPEALSSSAAASTDVEDAQLAASSSGEQDIRSPQMSAIYKYCFQGWTAYNDCNNYGAAGISVGYWSGYSCTYGNVYGGICYQGYALYVW